MRTVRRAVHRLVPVFAPVLLMAACASDPAAPSLAAARGGNGGAPIKVTATDPDSGLQGQRLHVRVLGSGYDASATATWERNGVPDPKITVYSTTFVSSSELVADIGIAADADTVLYDVAVTIVLSMTDRKKGVGVEKFAVRGNNAGGSQTPTVPYNVTMWGGLVSDPDPAGGAQAMLMYAWQDQVGHFHVPLQGFWRAYTGFANSKANGASCRKGSRKTSDATLAVMIEELTAQNSLPHRLMVDLDSAAVTNGVGSGTFSAQYDPPVGHPLYGAEVWVQVAYADRIAPEYGMPKVTREGLDLDGGTIYRFHAGDAAPGDGIGDYGAVGVWWRTKANGGGGWISCKLMDDVYVKVKPGPGVPEL